MVGAEGEALSSVGVQVAESGRAFAAVFRNPGLRRLNLALAGSVIGDWAYAIAVSVWAFQDGGAAALGLFGVARYVTMALLGPVLATLADRYPKKQVMIGADLARIVVVVAGAATVTTAKVAVNNNFQAVAGAAQFSAAEVRFNGGTTRAPAVTATGTGLVDVAGPAQVAANAVTLTSPGAVVVQGTVDAVATAVAAGRSVLVSSTNKRAVDEVVERLREQQPGSIIRTGRNAADDERRDLTLFRNVRVRFSVREARAQLAKLEG